jgi:uncharacterized protein (DUF488 family)
MFYRRKVILALLQAFGGEVSRLHLQKLLFVFTKLQTKKAFDFVPYLYGCYSFQASDDLRTMVKYNQISELLKKDKQYWKVEDKLDYSKQLNEKDRIALQYIKAKYSNYSPDDLIKHTYVNYPYFAIKSTIAKDVLTKEQLLKVQSQIPNKKGKALFTIGYEGISLETYLNRLIINDVKLLCDVRKNPLSMKNGFSKNQLKRACENVGIEYLHIPALGVESDKRQSLNTQSDYDQLFKEYKKTTITNNQVALQELVKLLEKYNRIALTCFEANHCQCHRGVVAKAITEMPGWSYKLNHI